jgi:hypothetical protein
MTERREPRIKPLSPRELESLKAGHKLEGGEIPPWFAASNKNTSRDLRRFSVELMLANVLEALGQETPHAKELDQIKVMLGAWQIGFNDRVLNTSRTEANKGRDKLEALYFEIEAKVNNLWNATGFDLRDKETWGTY